ncbi:MAG: solute carrier family 23 protein, partial [Flavipsychrobacter sp.]
GVVIAIVASIETLLCVEATDKLDPQKRYTPTNRELKAQGVGNLVSGLIGGLPMTSVIVRSSANVNAGGRTKLSTIIHGFLLLICVGTIPVILNLIPKASLAAILIYTGYKLCKPSMFVRIWKNGGLTQFIPLVVTTLAVVGLDLLKGVGIGMAIGIFYILRQNARIPFFYKRKVSQDGEVITITLAQEVSFLNKARLKQTLEKLPANTNVVLDASNTEYIDFDVLELIREFYKTQAVDRNIKMSLNGFKEAYRVPKASSKELDIAAAVNDDGTVVSSGDFDSLMDELDKEK